MAVNLTVLLNKEYHKWTSQQRRMVKGIIMARDGNQCFYCRKTVAKASATLEHLTPRAWGGSNFLDNLVLACAKCNEARGHSELISHLTTITRIHSVTHSKAMDYAQWVSLLTGQRMRVQWRIGGSATLTAVPTSATM